MSNQAAAAGTPFERTAATTVPGVGARRRTFSVVALREALTGRGAGERRPFEGLPVGPDMPTEFGPHHRWPDGSFHYCC